ncbi:MAG: dienelactone hydrolase family protein [Candidatus Binatia bacterium]
MSTTLLRTEELSFVRNGEGINAYGAWLRRDERFPAVIIVPDVYGLKDHYRDIARRFAQEGFFALAVDLYSREGAPELPDLESVSRWIRQLSDRRVLADIDSAVRFLGSRPEVRTPSIGITGFCMGGQYALMAACSVENLCACVSFYGMLRYAEKTDRKPESPLEMAPRLTCPYLGLFGEDDALIPRADIKELESILRRAGKTFQTKVYAGAGHAFFNDTRPDAYRPEAAKDAWNRAVTFLRTHLNRN